VKLQKNTGIMQGRLLPKYQGKYQAHPIGNWQQEFQLANQLGLGCIEFIFDYYESDKNPLLNFDGLKEIRKIEQDSGVKVLSICADYFMEAPLHSDNFDVVEKSLAVLEDLIKKASLIKVKDIVIPCVDQSSLINKKKIDNLIHNIRSIIKTAETSGINICLETDLEPKVFANMLDSIGSKNVTVNYDIGNSAALGYDPIEEFKAYGHRITDLHIKDRLLGGRSVPLGTGNADFSKIFDLLTKYEYRGIMIFQAYRDDEGVKIFKDQLTWFLNNFKN
tara:strand:- start:4398 stop:5228 length:831 start_codon:yes stop_codon:yes gene_type:complete